MLKEKAIKGLIWLLVIGVLVSASWAMGKKPAGSEPQVASSEQKAQVEVQSEAKENPEVAEAEKESAKVAGQKGTPTVEAKEVESIMEWQFDEEIVNIIFGEAEMTVKQARALGMKGLEQRKATETVKVQYPRVIITERTVKFLDERGKVERQIPKKDEYFVPEISEPTGRVIILESTEYGRLSRLVDKNGTVKKIAEGGEFFSDKLSGNGRYIVTGNSILQNGEDCVLYDIEGRELWRYTVPGTPMSEWMMHILYDGKVVIVANLLGEEKENIGRVTLIDIDGKKLWENRIVRGDPHDNILSTVDGKVIIYISESTIEKYTLYAFNEKGNLLWDPKEYKGLHNSLDYLSIPKNTNTLYGIGRGYLWAMDIDTGNILWQQRLRDFVVKVEPAYKPEPSLYEVSPNGKYVLLEGTFLLDGKTGNLLREVEGLGGSFLNANQIWRTKDNKVELINISDILK